MKKVIASVFTMMMLSLALAAVTAHAQATNQMKADIPFSFSIGNQTLPAGVYTVKYLNQDSGKTALLIKSADGRTSRIVMMTTTQKGTPQEKARLVFNQYGDSYFLAEVWTAGDQFGLALPKSRAERELARELAQSSKGSDVARIERRSTSVALVRSR